MQKKAATWRTKFIIINTHNKRLVAVWPPLAVPHHHPMFRKKKLRAPKSNKRAHTNLGYILFAPLSDFIWSHILQARAHATTALAAAAEHIKREKEMRPLCCCCCIAFLCCPWWCWCWWRWWYGKRKRNESNQLEIKARTRPNKLQTNGDKNIKCVCVQQRNATQRSLWCPFLRAHFWSMALLRRGRCVARARPRATRDFTFSQ